VIRKKKEKGTVWGVGFINKRMRTKTLLWWAYFSEIVQGVITMGYKWTYIGKMKNLFWLESNVSWDINGR